MGTPQFSVPALKALIESDAYTVAAVVTQPDKPAGRGQKLLPPATKVVAEEYSIPVFQPKSLKTIGEDSSATRIDGRSRLTGEKSSLAFVEFLNSLPQLDVIVAVAYGKILPPPLLHAARCGKIFP